MSRPSAGRVAIVTGASRGIGRAVARRLAARGAAVAVAARTARSGGRLPGSVGEVADDIRARGGIAIAVPCDVADPNSLPGLLDAVHAALGPVDILVNNAALTVPDRHPAGSAAPRGLSPREALSILNYPLSAYRRAFEVNLFGPYALTQLVLPDMLGRGRGNVVNISSDAAHAPGPGPYPNPHGVPLHAYGNSKAALEHFTRTVAYELAPRGIAVNAVLPSLPVPTPGVEFAGGGDLGPTLDVERFVDAVQLLCEVPAAELTGVVGYSEDLLEPARGRRGWLGAAYL